MMMIRWIWVVFVVGILNSCYAPEKTASKEYEEKFEGIKQIEVDGRFFEVSYEGREGAKEINLSAYLEYPESSGIDLKYRKSGSKLKIEVVGDFIDFGGHTSGYISLIGPEDVRLNFTCNSGAIDVMNVVHESINLQVNSGSIKAMGIQVDDIQLKASSGNITAEGLEGNVKSKVNSGSIFLSEVKGDVDAEASSGNLRFENIFGKVDAQVNSGSIKLDKVTELGNLKITSGNIQATEAGLGQFSRFSGNSGSIKIQTPSDLTAFNFDLSANSGSVKVGDNSSGKEVKIDHGSKTTIEGKVTSGSILIEN